MFNFELPKIFGREEPLAEIPELEYTPESILGALEEAREKARVAFNREVQLRHNYSGPSEADFKEARESSRAATAELDRLKDIARSLGVTPKEDIERAERRAQDANKTEITPPLDDKKEESEPGLEEAA